MYLWISSKQNIEDVEKDIRTELLNSPRIINFQERQEFVSCITSENQNNNFSLLAVGFCRKFSNMCKENLLHRERKNRKALFSAAWMKLLSNFQPNRNTQERSIIQIIIIGNEQFKEDVIYAVVSVIHELVYKIIHCRVKERKQPNVEENNDQLLLKESDDILYRYCGAALHRMIKLRKETIDGKDRGKG